MGSAGPLGLAACCCPRNGRIAARSGASARSGISRPSLATLASTGARLAPTTRLLLAAPHPTPPSGGRFAHDGRVRGQPSSAGRLCGLGGCRPPVAAGGRRPGPPRPAQTALLGRSATPGRAAAASVVVGWGGACTRAAPRRGWSGRCDAYGPSGTRTDLRYRGVGQGPAVPPQRGRLPFPPLFCKIFVHLVLTRVDAAHRSTSVEKHALPGAVTVA